MWNLFEDIMLLRRLRRIFSFCARSQWQIDCMNVFILSLILFCLQNQVKRVYLFILLLVLLALLHRSRFHSRRVIHVFILSLKGGAAES